jgi:3-hydroxyisobutyrate dehydrogenase/glyoxylate/succinic semialdehyde reductase
MAANLQDHGYQLVIFNRSRDQADALLKKGATWGKTPAGTAGVVDVLFTMPSLPDAVAAMAFGHSEFLTAMRPGSIWINSSTVNASFAQRMAEDARAKGVHYLDAPVIGSTDAAARGDLVFMVGGETSDLDVCRPLLSCMGKHIVHVGGHGLGSSLKMLNNLFAAVAALGQALGVPRQTILDTFHAGPEEISWLADSVPLRSAAPYPEIPRPRHRPHRCQLRIPSHRADRRARR